MFAHSTQICMSWLQASLHLTHMLASCSCWQTPARFWRGLLIVPFIAVQQRVCWIWTLALVCPFSWLILLACNLTPHCPPLHCSLGTPCSQSEATLQQRWPKGQKLDRSFWGAWVENELRALSLKALMYHLFTCRMHEHSTHFKAHLQHRWFRAQSQNHGPDKTQMESLCFFRETGEHRRSLFHPFLLPQW